MRRYKGRWYYQGRSWATLHEALLAVWPEEKQAPKGQKKTAHGAATTESGRGEKGLENTCFTHDYTTRMETAQV